MAEISHLLHLEVGPAEFLYWTLRICSHQFSWTSFQSEIYILNILIYPFYVEIKFV